MDNLTSEDNLIESTQQQQYERFIDMLHTAFGSQFNQWLNDPDVTEIMLNPDQKIFIETHSQGKIETPYTIETYQSSNIIKLLASLHNQVIDDKTPEIATELPEIKARFQGWAYPVVTAPCFVIRKHVSTATQLSDYIEQNSATAHQIKCIKKAIQERKNMVIIGGTGSGKTTLTNAILNELKNSNDRLLVLEDLPELIIHAPDHVRLRTSNDVSMRDLVKGTLRMRPDRIIIGEVRDGAALDLLKAWNTGHPGGICTLHANNPQQLPQRLEQLIQEVIPNVPKALIAQAIDLIIHIQRDDNGHREIKDVCRLEMDKQGEYKITSA